MEIPSPLWCPPDFSSKLYIFLPETFFWRKRSNKACSISSWYEITIIAFFPCWFTTQNCVLLSKLLLLLLFDYFCKHAISWENNNKKWHKFFFHPLGRNTMEQQHSGLGSWRWAKFLSWATPHLLYFANRISYFSTGTFFCKKKSVFFLKKKWVGRVGR